MEKRCHSKPILFMLQRACCKCKCTHLGSWWYRIGQCMNNIYCLKIHILNKVSVVDGAEMYFRAKFVISKFKPLTLLII